uniref:Uncharacterized protein n=1 Tax=Lepeophtheirus salmonis TaxID=72036 RepID=A0A0K2UVR4_LEPSM
MDDHVRSIFLRFPLSDFGPISWGTYLKSFSIFVS